MLCTYSPWQHYVLSKIQGTTPPIFEAFVSYGSESALLSAPVVGYATSTNDPSNYLSLTQRGE